MNNVIRIMLWKLEFCRSQGGTTCTASLTTRTTVLSTRHSISPPSGDVQQLNPHTTYTVHSASPETLVIGGRALSFVVIRGRAPSRPTGCRHIRLPLCVAACCCHRTKRISDVFLPSLSWLSSASFPGYHSLHYCLL